MAVISNTVGADILKALGIDSRMVLEVSLNLKANEIATVSIVRCLDKVEGDELVKVLEQYTLERKPEDPVAAVMETVARNLTKG